MRHVQFLARTVLVQNNNVEEAGRLLNRVLGKEEIFDQFRRTRFYEKPYQVGTLHELIGYIKLLYANPSRCDVASILRNAKPSTMRI